MSARWASADTIFQQTPQGSERALRRNIIVIREDTNSIFYKHFELKERRVVKIRLEKGSTKTRIERASSTVKKQILDNWKRFGHSGEITDTEGNKKIIYAMYLDFYPPGGRGSLHDTVPPRTTLPVLLRNGGVNEIEFSDIRIIKIQKFNRMVVYLKSGVNLVCEFHMPTYRPAEARFLGMTKSYSVDNDEVFDFFLPLKRLKEIKFINDRQRRRKKTLP